MTEIEQLRTEIEQLHAIIIRGEGALMKLRAELRSGWTVEECGGEATPVLAQLRAETSVIEAVKQLQRALGISDDGLFSSHTAQVLREYYEKNCPKFLRT